MDMDMNGTNPAVFWVAQNVVSIFDLKVHDELWGGNGCGGNYQAKHILLRWRSALRQAVRIGF
jgi:hypothetical protein